MKVKDFTTVNKHKSRCWSIFSVSIFWERLSPFFGILGGQETIQTVNLLDFFYLHRFYQNLNGFFITLFLSYFNENFFKAFSDKNIFGKIFFFENLSEGFVYVNSLLFNVINRNILFWIDNFDVKNFFLKIKRNLLRASKHHHACFKHQCKSTICWGWFCLWIPLSHQSWPFFRFRSFGSKSSQSDKNRNRLREAPDFSNHIVHILLVKLFAFLSIPWFSWSDKLLQVMCCPQSNCT